uniref:Large ribosomal subunit protein bL19c n=1 Tax=Melanthalia intermedia TaxID=172989 RepID=A0A345UAY9_9FLOR|nr:ribosomal protein L19 [Melanthalia intermedia]AXI97625.1 ribosomal protein L19 [Melanthalia intermedia]
MANKNLKVQKKTLGVLKIEGEFKKNTIPDIDIGDSIKISILIQEGARERVQIAEGVVISKNNGQIDRTITIRKVLQNVGVERVYLIKSPRIKNIEIIKSASVRRAKLYYLRLRSGKATRLKQKFD